MTEQQQKIELKKCLTRLGFERDLVEKLFNNLHFPKDQSYEIEINNLKIKEDLFIDLSFRKTGASDRYQLAEIRGVRHQKQEIVYTDINGISTADLEEQMKMMNWKQDYSSLERGLSDRRLHQQLLYGRYLTTIHNLIMLAADEPMGMTISNELKLRHLLGTPYEDKFVSAKLKEGASQGRIFYLDNEEGLSLPQISNILSGRAILWDLGDFMEGGKSWLSLHIKDDYDPASCMVGIMFKKQRRHPDYDLAAVLSGLQIVYSGSFHQEQLLKKLQDGDLVEIQLISNGKINSYAIAADPASKSICVYNDKGQRVDVSEVMTTPGALQQQDEAGKDKAKSKEKLIQQQKSNISKPGRKKGKGL